MQINFRNDKKCYLRKEDLLKVTEDKKVSENNIIIICLVEKFAFQNMNIK